MEIKLEHFGFFGGSNNGFIIVDGDHKSSSFDLGGDVNMIMVEIGFAREAPLEVMTEDGQGAVTEFAVHHENANREWIRLAKERASFG